MRSHLWLFIDVLREIWPGVTRKMWEMFRRIAFAGVPAVAGRIARMMQSTEATSVGEAMNSE